jgi:hypothetical protein
LTPRVERTKDAAPLLTLSPAVLRVLAAFYVILLMLLPRFVPVPTLIIAAAVLLLLMINQYVLGRPPVLRWFDNSALTLSFAGLCAVLFLACTWAFDPLEALIKVLTFASAVAVVLALSRQSEGWSPDVRDPLLQGLIIGMVVGALYIVIEMATGRELQRLVHDLVPMLKVGFGKHVRLGADGAVVQVSDAAINRTTFAFSCLFWPTLLALKNGQFGRPGRLCCSRPTSLRNWRLPRAPSCF